MIVKVGAGHVDKARAVLARVSLLADWARTLLYCAGEAGRGGTGGGAGGGAGQLRKPGTVEKNSDLVSVGFGFR